MLTKYDSDTFLFDTLVHYVWNIFYKRFSHFKRFSHIQDVFTSFRCFHCQFLDCHIEDLHNSTDDGTVACVKQSTKDHYKRSIISTFHSINLEWKILLSVIIWHLWRLKIVLFNRKSFWWRYNEFINYCKLIITDAVFSSFTLDDAWCDPDNGHCRLVILFPWTVATIEHKAFVWGWDQFNFITASILHRRLEMIAPWVRVASRLHRVLCSGGAVKPLRSAPVRQLAAHVAQPWFRKGSNAWTPSQQTSDLV